MVCICRCAHVVERFWGYQPSLAALREEEILYPVERMSNFVQKSSSKHYSRDITFDEWI